MRGQWYGIYEASEHMLEVFGTNEIPTPFRADISARCVYQWMRDQNPDMTVLVSS